MTDIEAVSRLLEVGMNAVLLFMLYQVWQTHVSQVKSEQEYMRVLVKFLMDRDATLPQPPRPSANGTAAWETRAPTNLGI